MAAGFVEKKEDVVNLLQVRTRPSNQVLLRVRFAEVSRSALTELGVSLLHQPDRRQEHHRPRHHAAVPAPGSTTWSDETATREFGAPSPRDGQVHLQRLPEPVPVQQEVRPRRASIKALQTRGLFQSLAEPNLVAESGKEASFLAGGEFPIPVAQGRGANLAHHASVQGVRRPPELHAGRSTATASTSRCGPKSARSTSPTRVMLQGFRIPALSTRRTETELELENGQTFAIAGLLNNIDDVDAAEDSRHRRHPDPRLPVPEQGGAEEPDRAGRDDHAGDSAGRLARRDTEPAATARSRSCRRCEPNKLAAAAARGVRSPTAVAPPLPRRRPAVARPGATGACADGRRRGGAGVGAAPASADRRRRRSRGAAPRRRACPPKTPTSEREAPSSNARARMTQRDASRSAPKSEEKAKAARADSAKRRRPRPIARAARHRRPNASAAREQAKRDAEAAEARRGGSRRREAGATARAAEGARRSRRPSCKAAQERYESAAEAAAVSTRYAMRRPLRHLRRDERGMSFVFVGVGFMAFMAATTLAIDVGMFMTARSQAQNAADAGALAGATRSCSTTTTTDRRRPGGAERDQHGQARTRSSASDVVGRLPADVTFPVGPDRQNNRVQVTSTGRTARGTTRCRR